MKSIVWVIAWVCVGLWSAVMALGYWLLNALTGFAANNADKVGGDAETVELVNWLALFLQNVGEVAAVIIWAIVSLLILAIAWVIGKLTGGNAGTNFQPPLKG
ncbi:hypothetical protein [Taklimakanibacter albus]|uniref:Uncharacterized protein n=1 Tax=Taklimakanibacter albus TaxID=2800327 RepID=A0ACC5QYM0_9HYPH|nr:hypothetical protein [Aestuariivirga sp. YIM B02566]MBK1865469.1 hypothetical protein [Aestuariivirga sp. YIM B02566]